MQIGKTIRKYRKERNMTQEEMARRLGVTTPAVNKWEKENSYPDITLLAPIARLLHISLDTLLSFQEELTAEEINRIIRETDLMFKTSSYAEVFQQAKSIMDSYPNCLMLIWQLAVVLDAHRLTENPPDKDSYDDYILDCFTRVLSSEDEALRTRAADSLFGYYLRNEQYDTAEGYLKYFSEQNPERQRKQAVIYSRTNRIPEAYKTYEQLLFSGYQMMSMTFSSLYLLAMEDKNLEKARKLTDKQRELARLFEMGKYHEASCGLDLAVAQKDRDAILETMEAMLKGIDEITAFRNSDLYEHLNFRETDPSFQKELKTNLLNCFQDEEAYGFLKDDVRWQSIVQQYTK